MSRESASAGSSFNSSWLNCSLENDSGILAKLRRLKIQEGLFLQNVNKYMLKNYDNGEEFVTSYLSSEYKPFKSNLRNSYCEVKSLFDSLKCNTSSDEALQSYDIDDIRTDVLELETKIKKLKNSLISEQTLLKAEELELVKNINVDSADSPKIIKYPKIKAKQFTDIVPSPVKNIIITPLKCQEVQRLQDFLKNYHRYGGWNEYGHNAFEKSWTKHFRNEIESNVVIDTSKIKHSHLFISELIEKLPGVTKEDIIQHSAWYLEYLHLKGQQQEALNKWKIKKKIIKKSQHKDKVITAEVPAKRKDSLSLYEEKYNKNTRHVNFAEEKKGIEEMFPVDLINDSAQASDTNDLPIRYSANASERKKHIRVENFIRPSSTRELHLGHEKPRGSFHFAKSTQQWNNKCNDKKLPSTNFSIPEIENIEKLYVPKWRMFMNNEYK